MFFKCTAKNSQRNIQILCGIVAFNFSTRSVHRILIESQETIDFDDSVFNYLCLTICDHIFRIKGVFQKFQIVFLPNGN